MKKFVVFGLFYLLLFNCFAKKDPQAWKSEKNLENQFTIFKSNMSIWDGYVMIKEPRLNEFHKSMMDTVGNLEQKLTSTNVDLTNSNTEIKLLSKNLLETQSNLETSLSMENELITLGISFNKKVFPPIVYSIIILVLVVGAFAFFLFFRSNVITKEAEKRRQELSEELQLQKVSALERETKLRRELQTERNKNYTV